MILRAAQSTLQTLAQGFPVLAITGPRQSGKTTLAKALLGIWPGHEGQVLLDDEPINRWSRSSLGRHLGYLPQDVELFEGTIAENISRFEMTGRGLDAEAIVEAAKRADIHPMILRLPQGYDTPVEAMGVLLSPGQRQRIALARALYGDPVLLILDEPNSNLDNDGSMALNLAIRNLKARGGSALIMAHRPAAIQECDMLLVLEDGTRRAFGPRDQILREMVKNHTEIVRSAGPGGVS